MPTQNCFRPALEPLPAGTKRLPGHAPRQPSSLNRYLFTSSLTACLTSSTAPFTLPLASSTFPSRSRFLSPVTAPAACLILPLTLSMISPIDLPACKLDGFLRAARGRLRIERPPIRRFAASWEPRARARRRGPFGGVKGQEPRQVMH